ETKRGSVSMLQRRLAIGYTRAARLVEMMGEAGILGEHKGTVAREVAMSLEEWRALKEQAAKDAAAQGAGEQGALFEDDEPASNAQAGAATPAAKAPSTPTSADDSDDELVDLDEELEDAYDAEDEAAEEDDA